MRRLAAGIAAAFALLVMIFLVPWGRLDCTDATCAAAGPFNAPLFFFVGFAFWLLLPLVVIGVIQVSVLGIRDSSQPHDLAVRAALGETGGSAVRGAALRGLRDGGLWVGGAYAISGVMHVVVLAQSSWPITADGTLWIARLVVGGLAVATLVVAHVIDAARPHRTPVERLNEDAKPIERRRGPRVLGMILATIGALACGVVAGLALAYDLAPSFYVTNAAGIAFGVAIVSMMGIALFVAIPASRNAVPWLLSRTARRMRGAAGSIVTSRAGVVTRASGRVVLVLGSFGYLLGAATSNDTAAELSPTYVGYVVYTGTFDTEAFRDDLRAIDGVAAVVMPEALDVSDSADDPGWMFAVDTGQLHGLDDSLAQILTAHPSAIAQNLWNGSAELHNGTNPAWGFQPEGIVVISRCCEMFTSASAGMKPTPGVTAYLIYSTDPALNDDIQRAVTATAPHDVDENSFTSAGFMSSSVYSLGPLLILLGSYAILLGTPIIALAIGLVRARRHDDATLAAMGATRGAIRAALVAETAAVTAFAMVVGTALGAVTRVIITALQKARVSLTGVITDSYLSTAFSSVAWLALTIAVIATVLLVAVTAWITATLRHPSAVVDGRQFATAGGAR